MKNKTAKVIMLPTQDRTNIVYNDSLNLLYTTTNVYFSEYSVKNNKHLSHQHLYLTTDYEIKEGDYVLHPIHGVRVVISDERVMDAVNSGEAYDMIGKCTVSAANLCHKKIIATTDTKPTVKVQNDSDGFLNVPLPQLSQKFIKQYCLLDGIDKVLVEYEEYGLCIPCNKQGVRHCAHPEECEYSQTLTRPKITYNNEIIINSVKDSWNRDEVEILLFDCVNDLFAIESNKTDINNFNKWIKENL